MKKRIEQLLNGTFEYEAANMKISVEKIDAVIRKGSDFHGSFTIENEAQRKMKGFIYSGSPRMEYEPSDFDGISEKIVYALDTAGMEEGDVLEGAFTICSNLGEYRVPYRIEIARSVVKTSTEVIGCLEDFEKLAREDFQKAYPIFISKGFRKMLAAEEPQWMTMYEGLTAQAVSYSSMEEFLVGIHAKDVLSFALEQESAFFEGLTQSQQESVALTKDNWGVQRLDIRADADFLQVERSVVTTDEFIGSSYRLNYVICPEKLHAGKNYGRILIHSPFQDLVFEVTAVRSGRGEAALLRKEQKQRIRNLTERYIDFRLHRADLEEWVRDSQAELEAYRKAGGSDPVAELYRAHLFFAAEKPEEACMILTELEERRENFARPEARAYYLYLTTFYNKEREYIDYVEENLLELFAQNRENWKLQWFLMYMQENLISRPTEKMEAIRSQFICGCRSRIMYLEAWRMIAESPLLLKKLGTFERCLLRFICREDLLDEDIIIQVGDLAVRHKEYSGELYEILKKCYDKKPSDSLVGAICSLLIKGNKEGVEYFPWYEKAVEADIRLTGLYEHYVNSMEKGYRKLLPQMVRMYFAYNNTLSYRRKALVYANVIANREEDPRTFQNYRPIIERFMVDQLAEGHINRDLALIYRTFLSRSVLNRRLAEQLARVIFTCEVRCDSPNARYAVVTQRQLRGEQRVALIGKKAKVHLYTGDYQIFIEDDRGIRCSASIPYEMERLLDDPELLALCREQAAESPEMILNICGLADPEHPVKEENAGEFCRLLEIEEIKESYREEIRQQILNYYYAEPKSPSLDDFLHGIRLEQFVQTDKKKLAELLIGEGMSREAFELIKVFGPETVDPRALVRMCSRNVLNREYEADDMLTAVCWYCFVHEKYDETILAFLVKYYDGPLEDMKRLWKAGREFELDTFRLEEKILLVLLFTRGGAADTEGIFDSYRRNLGKKKLLTAYAVYRAYDYFVREAEVQDAVFVYIEREYAKERELQEVCLLALLRWYAAKPSLTEEQRGYAQKLLEEFHYRGMQFAFYKEFDLALTRPFQLQDKSYVEYRACPEASVTLTWHLEKTGGERTEEISELMRNVYEGVFVKEFTLFYGESIHYTIREEWNGEQRDSGEQILSWSSRNRTGDDTCYDLINRLAQALEKQDEKAAEDVMELYLEQKCMADHIFPCRD